MRAPAPKHFAETSPQIAEKSRLKNENIQEVKREGFHDLPELHDPGDGPLFGGARGSSHKPREHREGEEVCPGAGARLLSLDRPRGLGADHRWDPDGRLLLDPE